MAFKLMSVDDSRTIRRIVSSYAKDLAPDVEIIEAANGQEALDKCAEELPDLIILDVNMPVMNGNECLEKLREQEETKNIPVVMLTTESEKSLVVKLLQLGVQQYIIKPFEKQEFLEKVGGVVAKIDTGRDSAAAKTITAPDDDYMIVLENKENITKMIEEAVAGSLTVVAVADGADAQALYAQKAPKLVMANVSMQEVDAFDMFVQMRKIPERASVRFIGMCLKTATDLINRCRGTGYIEVITKPFTADAIKGSIASSSEEIVTTEMQGDVFVICSSPLNFRKQLPIILKEVDSAAEEGYFKVMFDLSAVPETDLDDVALWGTIAEKTNGLGMTASYLSPSMEIVTKLKGLVDTQSLKVTTDHDEAMQALAA
jgi:two-component system, chemotaxis family, chemotaxis protein CheY